ncbi:MAG: Maf family protein [Oscillospiraceae bacterium]|nr:Maf family protein [Oscillospiraceae bacterium]
MALILASKSPRRQQLLRQIGLSFTVRVTDADETMDPAKPPQEEVARVSAVKAAAAAAASGPDDIVVAADTIVVVDGTVLGKPASAEDAVRMLRTLSGREHRVMTGLTVQKGSRVVTHTEITEISFRALSDAEIRAYVATGDPLDKAGSYGVQGAAGSFVDRICGDYFNVMGLPICTLTLILRRFGVEVLGEKG